MTAPLPKVLIQTTLYCRPWHILPAAHQELCELYRRYLSSDLDGRAAQDRPRHELALPACRADSERLTSGIAWAYDTEQSLAVVWLEGIIAKRAPDMMSGPAIVDLAVLDRLLAEIEQRDELQTVVFYLDTPGGCGIGLPETAQRIQELAETRTVVAYTDYQCCSAGYWLAAACDEIYAAPSAVVGSIGTYIAALDSSRAYEMEGLELKLFRHGDLKAIGLEGKPWTEAEEDYLAEQVRTHGEAFRRWVRIQRPGIEDATMRGQWFMGDGAPEGLLDGTFRDLADLLAALLEEPEDSPA